ncbi:universal stress protein [Neomicrococcus lactis]|uniref:Nucleotide-binding universal stress UspA family protein n=1 Tax=Neomicrococcus lactis TaxID=732241 RepID=A0A7W8YC38_9MICC|nr:universal stress protein [Neomicrococcus lactis]MBB5598830.1 nucleotide-binding universal stress UspA family protein [Neomicrococcus lactis]
MSNIIIVGVDGSDTAFAAASRAAALAGKTGDELRVVSAHAKDNTEVVHIGSDTWILDDADQANKLSANIAARLRQAHPGANITSGAIHGKPAEGLVKEAEALGAQLIVVGNVGMKGLGRVLGSVASGVVNSAPCDVYIVKTS